LMEGGSSQKLSAGNLIPLLWYSNRSKDAVFLHAKNKIIMKSSSIFFCVILFLSACKGKSGAESKDKSKTKFPAAATSKESVKHLITNKDFVTVKAGLFVPGEPGMQTPYNWLDESKDTSGFTKQFLDNEMSFELYFNYDNTGVIFYGKEPSFDSKGATIYIKKSANITYAVDDSVTGNERPGIKLRVYEEQRNNFDGGIEKLGSTYKILGADENGILLQAPRNYYGQAVVVLLTPKEKTK
jgi:hypothetical protein